MPDYQNGKIYKLVNDENDDIYYGSTSQPLPKRIYDHKAYYKRYLNGKTHYMTSYEIVKYSSCKIILVENFPCKSKYELEARERYYIEKYECVNKIKPANKISSYETGKIYKLVNDETDDVYYGSTIQTLQKRFTDHNGSYNKYLNVKCAYMTSYEIVKYSSCKIILVENFPCNSKEELEARERYYIEKYKCVNKVVPTRSKKEYYEDNKEKISKQRKEFYQENKEEILKQKKEYRLENEEKIKEYKKQYRSENKEKIKDQSIEYYYKNKDEIKEQRRQFRLKNKEYIQQYQLENKEKLKEYKKQYFKYQTSWGGYIYSYSCNLLRIDPYLFT